MEDASVSRWTYASSAPFTGPQRQENSHQGDGDEAAEYHGYKGCGLRFLDLLGRVGGCEASVSPTCRGIRRGPVDAVEYHVVLYAAFVVADMVEIQVCGVD